MEDEKIERLRERILQCPICIDEYKDPRILPCHHTVCLNCLLDYVRHSSSSGRLFRCPQCRSDICVPRGGVKDFPPNFYVNCIQDELGSRPYFGICDVCERDWLVSQYRCVDCDLDICRFCIHEHRLFKHEAGSNVTIMRIETGNIGTHIASQRGCESHSEETLQMYCKTCEKAVCVTCVCESHKKHETIPLVKKLSESQKDLQMDLDKLKSDTKLVQSSLNELQDHRHKIQECADKCVTSIRRRARDLSLEMDRLAEERIEKIRHNTRTNLQDLDAYVKELDTLNAKILLGSGFLEELQEDDVSLELFSCFDKYKRGLDLMMKSATNKNIQIQTSNFETGKMMHGLGCHFFRFGDLNFDKEKRVFMQQEQTTSSRLWTPLCISVMKAMFRLIFVLVVITGQCILTHRVFCTEDWNDLDDIAGWMFFTFLTLTGVFAFSKSRQ